MNEAQQPAETESVDADEAERRRRLDAFAPRDDQSTRLSQNYSRFVNVMRWLLPSAAVALVALVIAWPSLFGDAEGVFPDFGERDGGGLRITGPRYLGVDSRDHPFAVTADAAVQVADIPQRVSLDTLEAQFSLEDGTALHIEAKNGLYDRRSEVLHLAGWVDIRSADGYELLARNVRVDLSNGFAVGSGAVKGSGAFGELEANGFHIDKNGRNLKFSGGVRLLIRTPKRAKNS